MFIRYDGVNRKITETYDNIFPYLDDEDTTKSLRNLCSRCERYCGEEHVMDYSECRDEPCFIFWLAYKYLELSEGW